MTRLATFVLLATTAACTLTEEFDEALLGEHTEAACSDGLDNDGDGLTDCQQLACLGFEACCDVPAVVLEDEFPTIDDACGAPDPGKWSAWGAPYPEVCEGALWPNKPNACYDVGVLARRSVTLQPGATAVAGVAGRPETLGRLGVGLTFQEAIIGGIDACAPIDGATPFAAIQQEYTASGYRFAALFDQQVLATSATVTGDDRHEVSITVGDDGRLHYAVDGEVFASSPEAQPVAGIARDAYLVLYGRGVSARFTDAAVYAGSQCEAPAAWTPAERFVALAPGRTEDDTSWDWREVFSPFVQRGPLGRSELFYRGCNEVGECDVGRATESDSGAFERDPANPVGQTGAPWRYPEEGLTLDGFSGPAGTTVVIKGPVGAWDHTVVGYAAIERDGTYYLWYEGRSAVDRISRIGLAVSTDGGLTFDKHPDNPVIQEGPIDAYDGRGIGSPTVAYDEHRGLYRMWYVVDGFLGASSSLGYAVSTDGVHWVKHEGPVLTAEDLGLFYIGHPSVVADGGGYRLWVDGTKAGESARQIYEVVNRGVPFGQ